MLLNIEKSGEQDAERALKWLASMEPDQCLSRSEEMGRKEHPPKVSILNVMIAVLMSTTVNGMLQQTLQTKDMTDFLFSLTLSQTSILYTLPNSKSLQTTISNLKMIVESSSSG